MRDAIGRRPQPPLSAHRPGSMRRRGSGASRPARSARPASPEVATRTFGTGSGSRSRSRPEHPSRCPRPRPAVRPGGARLTRRPELHVGDPFAARAVAPRPRAMRGPAEALRTSQRRARSPGPGGAADQPDAVAPSPTRERSGRRRLLRRSVVPEPNAARGRAPRLAPTRSAHHLGRVNEVNTPRGPQLIKATSRWPWRWSGPGFSTTARPTCLHRWASSWLLTAFQL